MTTGEKVKSDLNLDDYPYVSIARVLGGSYKMYYVWFDSYRSSVPLTRTRIESKPYTAMMFRDANFRDKMTTTPPIEIERFDTQTLSNTIFFIIDLGGSRFVKNRVGESTKNNNIPNSFIPNLDYLNEEGFLLKDWKASGTSSNNKKFLKIRRDDGIAGIFFQGIDWNEGDDTLRLIFHANPTWEKSVPVINKKGQQKSASFYTIELLFENVNNSLGSIKDFLEMSKGEQRELIRDLINTKPIKIHSDDMSFFYQGVWENGADLDFGIYPFPGPSGKGIWSKRQVGEAPGIYSTKHILEAFGVLPFIETDITQAIRNNYSR